MIQLDDIRCLVFDFAGTLCSETYFNLLGAQWQPQIAELVFGANSPRWADPWMLGQLSAEDIARYLSGHLPFSAEHILDCLYRGCAALTFNPEVWELALRQQRQGRKTALVTGNMDVFTQVVVPSHRLDQAFDVIVNSADCGEGRKEVLWRRAFAELAGVSGFADSLLLEDSLSNVLRFRELGGMACHYTGDQALLSWLARAGM